MFFRFGLNLLDFICLLTCGIVFGVTMNLISKANEMKTHSVRSSKAMLNSTELFDKVRILCIVMTTESHHKTKAIHVKNTWGSRCNKLLFASNVTDTELGSVNLLKNDTYDHLWGKVKHAMAYAHENYRNDFDWFYKADDDTFAIIDNMRYLLYAYSPNDPIYFGKKLKATHPLGFFHGGSGYVMSKEALKKFVTEALPNRTICNEIYVGQEDGEIGRCMYYVGVYAGDSRDRFLRETFHPFVPEAHLFAFPNAWYWHYVYYPTDEGLDCCSNSTIAFHYIRPDMMYLMEYSLIHLQAYGVRHMYDPMPHKKNFADVIQKLLTKVNKTINHQLLT